MIEANSADQAINEAANEADGRWVAVPVRNWHEQDRDVEQRNWSSERVAPEVKQLKIEEEVAA